MGFVYENRRPGDLMKFPHGCRPMAGQRLEKLNRRRYDNGSVPSRGEVTEGYVGKFSAMVVRHNCFVRALTGERDGITQNGDALVDDICKWKDDKNTAQASCLRNAQQVCHHGRRFPRSNGTVARSNGWFDICVPACLIYFMPDIGAFAAAISSQTRNVVIEPREAISWAKRQRRRLNDTIEVPRGIGMVGIDETGKSHSPPETAFDALTG